MSFGQILVRSLLQQILLPIELLLGPFQVRGELPLGLARRPELLCAVSSRPVPSLPVASRRVASHGVAWRRVASRRVPSPPLPFHSPPLPSLPLPSALIPSCPAPSHPVPSRPVPSRPIPSRPIPSHPIPPNPHPVPSRPVPSRPIPYHPIPSHPILFFPCSATTPVLLPAAGLTHCFCERHTARPAWQKKTAFFGSSWFVHLSLIDTLIFVCLPVSLTFT